jgi:hypothetical protein
MVARKPAKHIPYLLLLLLLALLIRIPFLSAGVFHNDAFNNCMGGIYQFVAHPPGFVGFCSLGMLVNRAVGNINTSFVWINLVATLIGIYFCYKLALAVGMDGGRAVAVAAMYAASINLLYFSTVALSYSIEGMFSASIGWLAYTAVTRRSCRWALAVTLVWAVSGAFRPTTTVFLFPLWLYVVWRTTSWHSRASVLRAVILFVCAAPIIYGWSAVNKYFLAAKTGFDPLVANQTYELQVMMPTTYDYSHLAAAGEAEPVAFSYHWPCVELFSLLERKLNIHLLPHSSRWPEPSLAHAARLSGMQFFKLSFYTIFSAPLLLLAPVALFLRSPKSGDEGATPPRVDRMFFLAWIAPPALFYTFGHFGSFGYLQVFLPGLFVLLGSSLLRSCRRSVTAVTIGVALVGMMFFLLARPLRGDSNMQKILDVIAFQYTGQAIRDQFATARRTLDREDGAQCSESVRRARSDKELLDAARAIGWDRNSYYKMPE